MVFMVYNELDNYGLWMFMVNIYIYLYLVANYPRIVSGLVHPSDLHGIFVGLTVNPLITGFFSPNY
jgi:hypothetical protein